MKTKYVALAIAAMMTGMMFTACQKDDNKPNDNNGGNGGNGGSPAASVGGFREDGASNALFTVAEGRQVRFSRGNLQYQASTGTWRFAENQYDCIGMGNQGASETYDGWIDNFSWGTSGWESGATTYKPWQLTALPWDGNYPGGSADNDLTGDYAEADWAWHNAISNGGNQTHKWRTLTGAEWMYLTETRPDAAAKCGLATVGDMAGVVILPDTWTAPSGLVLNTDCNAWDNNVYTIEQWGQMENAGALFLPATGYSTGWSSVSVYQLGESGNYWSASHYDNDESYCFFFNNEGFTTWNATRTGGRSVRPVTD